MLNLDVLERMLALEGARATRASDGREALARLKTQANDFDAVLMDVQMPVLDGLSATRAIRGELGLTQLPVIAVTAGVLKTEQQRAREAGVDDVLPKPVDLDHLVEVLSRWAPRAAAKPDEDAARAIAPIAPDGAPETAAIPAIMGIDQAHVARLTRGDVAFYRRLLVGLVGEARGVPEQVRADLARGTEVDAAARLHRLRGVAANLGALELAALIRALEEALVADRSAITTRLAEVEAHLTRLLSATDDWLARTEPVVSPTAEASSDAAEGLDPVKLAALREALAANRPRPARTIFAELRAGLSGRYGPAVAQAIATQLAALDLPAALHALDEAMSATAVPPACRHSIPEPRPADGVSDALRSSRPHPDRR